MSGDLRSQVSDESCSIMNAAVSSRVMNGHQLRSLPLSDAFTPPRAGPFDSRLGRTFTQSSPLANKSSSPRSLSAKKAPIGPRMMSFAPHHRSLKLSPVPQAERL